MIQENRALDHPPLCPFGPVMKPLSQYDQAFGELVLLLGGSVPFHDEHRQRHHIGIDAGQLCKQLAVFPDHVAAAPLPLTAESFSLTSVPHLFRFIRGVPAASHCL